MSTTTGAPPSTESPTRSWLPLAAIGVTLVFWASAFVAIRHLAGSYRPGSLALGRMVVGALCLSAVVWWSHRGRHGRPAASPARAGAAGRRLVRPGAGDWVRIVAIGVLWYAVYMLALNAGERRVDAGTSAMLIQLSPILIAVLAAVFLGERFTRWLVVGLVLAFAGVVVISVATSDGSGRDLLGVVLCLVSAVAYAVSLVLQKPLSARYSALQLTWMACGIGAIVMLPWLGELVTDVRTAPVSATLWVIYLGVFPTAVAFTTYGFALSHLPASRLGIATYVVPVITVLLAWAFLGETPPALADAGGVLALAGVALSRRR